MEKLTEEQVKFMRENINLMYKFISNIKMYNEGVSIDSSDWHGIISEAMIRAIKTYDASKASFPTYFYIIAKRSVISEQRRINRYNMNNILDKHYNEELFNNKGYTEEGYKMVELTYGIHGRQREVMELKLAGYTNSEIASELNVHRNTVVNDLIKIREVIRNNI